MNRLRFEHIYFCRNCEDEFRGQPYGIRIVDRLPLCKRCTSLGERDGIADRLVNEAPALSKSLVYFIGAIILFGVVLAVKVSNRIAP